jgi:hypothetical protein
VLTCLSDILYSEMESGNWTVFIQATSFDFTSERTFGITVGKQDVVVITVCFSRLQSIPKSTLTRTRSRRQLLSASRALLKP